MNEEKIKKPQEDIVLVKKYANRRLYNTQTSSYITLEDLADLVKQGIEFQVLDAKSEEDLTRQILVQIMLEQEMAGVEMLPVELLRSFIRYCDTEMHQNLSNYLTQALKGFFGNQDQLYQSFSGFTDWNSLQKKQAEWFQQAMGMMTPPSAGKSSSESD